MSLNYRSAGAEKISLTALTEGQLLWQLKQRMADHQGGDV